MARVVRIALMWLIALAVPLQGFAATSMLFCAPAHEAAAHHEHPGHDHVQHGHAHHAAAPDAHASAGMNHDDAGAQSADKSSATKCSVCASCCSAVTMPAEPMTYTPSWGHAVFRPVATSSAAIFLTGGQDRPPQHLLA